MLRYNEVIEWIEKNFSSEELSSLEHSNWEMESDAYNLANTYLVPAKYNWTGERISFKNYVLIFKHRDLLGYYHSGKFTERTCIHDWNLCEFFGIKYINPFEIDEKKWGVLKYKNNDLYIGIETPVGNDLVNSIYKANIIGAIEWQRIKESGCEFFSESLDDGTYIDNDDLEFIEIEITVK